MPSSKLDRDLPLIQQNWNNFISLIKQDLNELTAEQKKLEVEIRKVERISKILKVSDNDINFIIAHKESIIEVDPSLISKFALLEAFKKRNNLDNDLAVQTYIQIKNSVKITELLNNLEVLMRQSDLLQEKIDSLRDLIYGEDYSQIGLINELCKKHNIGEGARKMLFTYPIIKTLRKPSVVKEKTREVKSVETPNRVSTATVLEEIEVLDDDKPTEIVVPEPIAKEETRSYEDEFNQQKNRYDKFRESVNDLLSKYYTILNEMKPYETQFYRTYCSYTEEEFGKLNKNQFEEGYDEAKAKILAIKVFDARAEIDKILSSIVTSNYTDKDEIDYLAEFINEFQSLCDKLKVVDKQIVDKNKGATSLDSKVFFLTDRLHGSFIPEEMRKGVYQRSLMNIMVKAQEGLVSQKKGCNIMTLKVHDAKYRDQIGRTVFAIRNNKIMVSYIKLNTNSEISNDGGIIILTAAPLTSGTDVIQTETNKVIKDNIEQLVRQLALIEAQEPQQLELQALIRDELMQTEEQLGEDDVNGHKIR